MVQIESEVDAKGVETLKALRTRDVDDQGNRQTSVLPIGKSGSVEYTNSSGSVSVTKGGIEKELNKTDESAELKKESSNNCFL